MLRTFAVAAVVGAVLVACGGDDGGDAAPELDAIQPEAGSGGVIDDGGSQDTGRDVEAPNIDPATMPAPGEAEVDVDGNVFAYRQSESLGNQLFSCELSDDEITVNFQTPDGQDLLVQVTRLESGMWGGSVVVASSDSDRTYESAPDQGAFAVEGSQMVYEGPFDSRTLENPTDLTDAGDGRIEVTCP